ncbi:Eco57I restriction-modification methylase domain-containing protein [Thermus caliditerrae]|uniref:Eco57I restriction-modification methylase domain-containing protein n=1 Tax=Thermus caliditerrae TaxID=1330700 RepID=UPI00057165DD|nr:N-6 DNA methylase [Thermus caliditerrae]
MGRRDREEARALRDVGGLLGQGFLERLGEGFPGQAPRDFGLKGSLQEAIAEAYEAARGYWQVFRRRLERLAPGEKDASLTREGFVLPFLGLLGYQPVYQGWAEAAGRKWPISHRADPHPEAPPLLVVPFGTDLSRADRALGGRSPHGLLQDYLNASGHLYGLVTDGRALRLLRQNPFVRRQAYLEADLEAILSGDGQAEFALLFRLLHRTRLPRGLGDRECLLERYHQEALSQGERARERLREGVEAFLRELGTGFLEGPGGEGLAQDPQGLYEGLLRLAYRLLFLLVAEARGVLGGNRAYREGYSLARLLRLADEPEAYTEDTDLWQGLKALFHLLRDPTPVPELGGEPLAGALGLHVLNGRLFEPLPLEGEPHAVSNARLLRALRHLAYYWDGEERALKRVNYAALDVEELGSVYEGLLDYRPVVRGGELFLEAGTERKRTGSYYTPEALVDLVLREALDPVVEARLREAGPDPKAQEEALLALKVLDPAAGSGHFLLGAARRLGRRLAQVRTGEEEPSPEAYRQAVRDVAAHCLYGVDKNPLAVELCRVALWMESHVPGKPLTFLDHRIKAGDSLVGVLDPEALRQGLPDGAFEAKEGDDKDLARALKARNRRERGGERELFAPPPQEALEEERAYQARMLEEFARLPEDRPQEVLGKARLYEELQGRGMRGRLRLASDLWAMAFFQPLKGEGPRITTGAVWDALEGRVDPRVRALAEELARRHRPFHWWLEFPEVFQKGGFDVVLGNPPWEVLEPKEEEFFQIHDPKIAALPGNRRKEAIARLERENPSLFWLWREHVREINSQVAFMRVSGRFPLTAKGDANTYRYFAELAFSLLGPQGKTGLVLPEGIATGDSNKQFFQYLTEGGYLRALYMFNNEELFSSVGLQHKLFTVLVASKEPGEAFKLVAHISNPKQISDEVRLFTLSPEDFRLLNPNTRTCPVFRTRQDAELTKAIYRRVPVLWRESPEENPWRVFFRQGLFNMTSDSALFREREALEGQGFTLAGNRFVRGEEVYLPLYEAKMVWQYDHRFATYEEGETRDLAPEENQDPTRLPLPRYWVRREEVEERLVKRDRNGGEVWRWGRGWLLGFRNVTNTTNERTLVPSFTPAFGVGHSLPLLLPQGASAPKALLLLGNLSALVLDYVARQKVGGTNLTLHFLKQFPVLPPDHYTPADLLFLVPRILELTYTAWDLAPLAQDVWQEADEALRGALLAQHRGNGGHPDAPPPWAEGPYPFPPFRWDEERRALLRAELDAYYARLYGLNRKQLRYILDPEDLTPKELADILSDLEEVEDPLDPQAYRRRREASAFPGETFRVLREKEEKRFGEYRTRRLVLEAWARLFGEK